MVTSLKRWKAEELLSAKSTGLKPESTERLRAVTAGVLTSYCCATGGWGGPSETLNDASHASMKNNELEGFKERKLEDKKKFCRCNKHLVLEVLSKNGTRKMNLMLDPWFDASTFEHHFKHSCLLNHCDRGNIADETGGMVKVPDEVQPNPPTILPGIFWSNSGHVSPWKPKRTAELSIWHSCQ